MPRKASNHRRAEGDAANKLEDAPKGLQPQRGQEGMQPMNPRMLPKKPNQRGGDARKCLDQGGKRGCSQGAQECPPKASNHRWGRQERA